MIVNRIVDQAARALQAYHSANHNYKFPTSFHTTKVTRAEVIQARVKAQKLFAQVDWVEPEVDPDTIQGAYLEMVYQAGRQAGMLTMDEMTDNELELYGVF